MLRPSTFVAGLFVMAVCCVVIALSDRSWGWLAGGTAQLAVTQSARRLKGTEEKAEGLLRILVRLASMEVHLKVAAI